MNLAQFVQIVAGALVIVCLGVLIWMFLVSRPRMSFVTRVKNASPGKRVLVTKDELEGWDPFKLTIHIEGMIRGVRIGCERGPQGSAFYYKYIPPLPEEIRQ